MKAIYLPAAEDALEEAPAAVRKAFYKQLTFPDGINHEATEAVYEAGILEGHQRSGAGAS